MKAYPHTPLFAACCAASLLFIAGGGSIIPLARAACTSGAQCVVNGFPATVSPVNDSFQSSGSGTDWDNAAVQALNGGVITGDALVITAPNEAVAKQFDAAASLRRHWRAN